MLKKKKTSQIHTTHSQIYITQAPSRGKHVNPRHTSHTSLSQTEAHALPPFAHVSGISPHASESSLTCLPASGTPRHTQHSFSVPSSELPSVPWLSQELSPCTPLRVQMFLVVSNLPEPQPLGWKHDLGVGLVPGNTGTEQPADARWLPGSWREQLK